MYCHNYEFGPPHFVLPFYGVRTERYKLISYYTIYESELFDLEKDPDRMESLFGNSGYQVNPAYASVLPELVNELEQLRKKYNH